MATISQVEKTDYTPVRISYTDKDYANILDDLINSISGITQKWNTTDINDPGMVLVRLMAILGDMLFYNQDMQSLEVYPNSVTQRKNAASIYKLIGYKMRWYKSATLQANMVNTYNSMATIPRFCTFTTLNNDITYCTFDEEYNLKSNTNNNGFEELVTLVQGTPVTPVRTSNNPYPDVGKPWHSIYGFNYTTDDIVNNRIYLAYNNVDQDHIIVVDDTNNEWVFKENIYLTRDAGRFFEFGVDVNDNPYIELVDYWGNFNVHKFKIFYIRSSGENGQIYANTLKNVTGNVWSRNGTGISQAVYNVSNFIKFTHYDSTLGYNPETPNEARKNATMYQNTLDTLITLADFERAALRHPIVSNVRATDLTNDPGIQKSSYIGDINQDGTIDELDYQMLENYCVDPVQNPLNTFEKRLANLSQDGNEVGKEDLQLFYNYLHPALYTLGNITMKDESTAEQVINEEDLQLLQEYVENPEKSTLTNFQIRLADMNQDGLVNEIDIYLMQFWLGQQLSGELPQISDGINTWTCGNINMDKDEMDREIFDNIDLDLLDTLLNDPSSSTLTTFQKKLCDVNQDGITNAYDYELLKFYIQTSHNNELPKISDDSKEVIGMCGKERLSTVETLDGFIVKLYIIPTEEYEDYSEEDIQDMITEDLRQYKILPLTLVIDTHSINKYYWTIKGKFITKSPLSKDELQTIIVSINNKLRYEYATEKMNFNNIINYKDIIEDILSVDQRILMVDLEPIEYVDDEGNTVSKETVTGNYQQIVPMLDNANPDKNLHYAITLQHTTVLPGSVMIKTNGGQYVFRDNNNGEIYNIDGQLQYKGSINYITGEIDLMFTAPVTDDIVIDYTHNTTNIAIYRNLSTQNFYFDSSSLEPDGTQNLV